MALADPQGAGDRSTSPPSRSPGINLDTSKGQRLAGRGHELLWLPSGANFISRLPPQPRNRGTEAILSATETGSGRIRGISGCPKASSRITTGQRDTSIRVRRDIPTASRMSAYPHRLASHLILTSADEEKFEKSR